MAWPSVSSGNVQRILASDYTAIVNAIQTWQGNVSANGFGLSNLNAISGPAFGSLTEAVSSVLTITGGASAVVGNVSIQVKQASATQNGYLSATDWSTFNAKQNALTLPLSIANGGTGQATAAAALAALGGVSLTGNNSFSGSNSFTQLVSYAAAGVKIGAPASGSPGALQLVAGFASPLNTRLAFGTDGTGYKFGIAKNQGGTYTDLIVIADSGATSFSGAVTLAVAPVFSDQAGTRTALGLGTAATLNSANLTEITSSVLTITGGTNAVLGAGTTIQVKQASGTQAGYLSAADWTTFNGKQSALATGNLTELTSAVLTITGGTGAVIGSGVSIQVKQASGTQNGYLSSTDWTTFNNKQAALALPLSIANGGTGAATAAGALTALGGASLTANNTFSGTQVFNGLVQSNLSGNAFFINRPSNFASNAVLWNLGIQNAGASDTLIFGQSGSAYATGGSITWIGNSMAFLYYPNADFRIGTGVAATPVITLKGNRNVIIGSATDGGQQFQVTGSAALNGAIALNGAVTIANPSSVVFAGSWIDWTPTLTPGGSMIFSSVTILSANYLRIGPICYFKAYFTFTVSGTPANNFTVSLPFATSTDPIYNLVSGAVFQSVWTAAPSFTVSGSASCAVNVSGGAALAAGSTQFAISGFYRVAA